MYRNLLPKALGLNGCRDNELVELAMTYRFSGMELSLQRFQDQVKTKGLAAAERYLRSAPLRVSTAELPLNLSGNEAELNAELQKLSDWLDSAEAMRCATVYLKLAAGSPDTPFPQNFERHCRYLATIAELVAARMMRLGLSFSAVRADLGEQVFPFIQTAEGVLAILKMVNSPTLCLILDSWQWWLGGGTVNQLRSLTVNQIGDVRFADVPENTDAANATWETRRLPSSSGIVDNLGIMRWLVENEYAGPVTPAPHRSQIGAVSREACVERASQSIDRLWEEAGYPGATPKQALEDAVATP